MSKRNIFLIFALLVLICSIDFISGNELKNLKKIQNNNLDTKFSRKLDSPGRIRVEFTSGEEFECNLESTFKTEDKHPSRKFVSEVNRRFKKRESKMENRDMCQGFTTNNEYLFYFSQETNSLEDLFNSLDENFRNRFYVLDLTDFDISVITSFKNAFSNLPNLQRIIFPTNIMTKPNKVTEMLKGCLH